MRNLTRTPLPSLVLLVLAGCGGGGGHHTTETGTDNGPGIVFSSAKGYNGSGVTLTGTARLVGGDGTPFSVQLTKGSRYFFIDVPDLAPGDSSFDLSASQETLIYNEGGASAKTWKATAGTLRLSNVANDESSATVTLTGVTLSPSDVFGTTTGTGTFRLDGNLEANTTAPVGG